MGEEDSRLSLSCVERGWRYSRLDGDAFLTYGSVRGGRRLALSPAPDAVWYSVTCGQRAG
ncbi:MAG: hypothetical protein ACRDRW_04570 [Pseudonocardiaceae bacterium]